MLQGLTGGGSGNGSLVARPVPIQLAGNASLRIRWWTYWSRKRRKRRRRCIGTSWAITRLLRQLVIRAIGPHHFVSGRFAFENCDVIAALRRRLIRDDRERTDYECGQADTGNSGREA
jgi:hypothetical protein